MRHVRPVAAYYMLEGGRSFLFALVFTVSGIYRIQTVGLNPLELVLVGTVLEAAVFLAEVPTGVVADVYSRKASIIIGLVIVGAGFVLEGSVPFFVPVLLAQVVWGVGFTFTSGADSAWIADEVGAAGVAPIYLRAAQVGQAANLVGIFVSVALATLLLRLPIVLGGVLFILLAGVLWFVMAETGFSPTPRGDRTTWQSMASTVGEGFRVIRTRAILPLFLGVSVFYGLASEGFDRLWELHILSDFSFPQVGDFEPIVWFGVINAGAMLLSILAAEAVRRLGGADSPVIIGGVLVGINMVLVGTVLGFALAGNFAVAVATYWASSLLRYTNEPLLVAWANHHLESRSRATVLSVQNQANAIGQVVGGPILGFVATITSTVVALVASALLVSPAVALYWLARRTEVRQSQGTTAAGGCQ